MNKTTVKDWRALRDELRAGGLGGGTGGGQFLQSVLVTRFNAMNAHEALLNLLGQLIAESDAAPPITVKSEPDAVLRIVVPDNAKTVRLSLELGPGVCTLPLNVVRAWALDVEAPPGGGGGASLHYPPGVRGGGNGG